MQAALILSVALTVSGTATLSTSSPVATAPVVILEDGHQHGKDEIHKLGRKKIGDYTVSVIMIGEAEAGAKVKFDIKLIDAKADPKSLHVWIGAEDAKDDAKTKLTKGEKTYAGEVTVPSPLPAGAKVWVEVETDAGKSRGAFETDTHDHKH